MAFVLIVPAFAGCFGDGEDPDEKVQPGSTSPQPNQGSGSRTPSTGTGSGSGSAPASPTPKIKSSAERWHFHDYWKNTPTITLLDGNFSLMPAVGGDGMPALSAIVELPQGTIVPPETGFLTFNVTWNGTPSGLLNLTYRPADSNDFQPGADLAHGTPFELVTTESMCDVPHRQQSFWRFNLTAKPGGTPPAMPPKDFRLVVTATIGRPLFIDPPHMDWWQGRDTIPIVEGAKGEFQGAATAVGNLTIPHPAAISPASARPSQFTEGQRVPVAPGRIVPEGSRSVVVSLAWSDAAPQGAKLKVAWKEGNSLTSGAMDVLVDGEGARVFAIPISPGQTDTTYSNRTTWEFQVLPDHEPPAFKGSYVLSAWASRLAPADAVAEAMGGAQGARR